MGEIIRNRVIRPSSRLEPSSYRVNTENVTSNDTLLVNVTHESKEFFKTFYFSGVSVADRNSIHFNVVDSEKGIDIHWKGVQPMRTNG